jgi:thiamine biosynthesis lipoprotein
VVERFEFMRPAMGTQFRITLFAANAEAARAAADTAFDRIDKLEEILSDYQADSELSLLREAPPGTALKVSEDLFAVLWQAREVSERTYGVFDVTAGPYTRLWRFSRKRKTLPSQSELAEARSAVGFEKLHLDATNRTVTLTVPGMRLDVGGIAKGYSADAALALLKDLGFPRALVAASGDIVAGDAPPGKKGWRVAISNMAGSNTLGQVLLLRHMAVSTSGDSEQSIEIEGARYSHILDMRTGLGLTNQVQATVVAPRATITDALATALRSLGAKQGMTVLRGFPRTSALIVEERNGRSVVTVSRGFRRHAVKE